MSAAIDAIKAQIKSKRAALAKAKEQAEELKRLQAAVAAIPRIQMDLSALERTLAILRGEETPKQVIERVIAESAPPQESIGRYVYDVLKEAGKPMKGDQILPLIIAKGKNTDLATMMGALYRYIKRGQWFRKVGPGTIGLLGWEQ